eukprot:CAMPEP_0168544018 /NCGR_PEP_ID=MMETSP0413-20121227/2200_1 /TAXON_ID=136452 /ORGANISM="Filamoeba nolandi, Strain NC-AS-23-1" /LENGTH=589 /DNA_ID=CAMNT_0008574019 /DNA_START=61 /DNA_END=1828 /DNA_ORIENTATION=+
MATSPRSSQFIAVDNNAHTKDTLLPERSYRCTMLFLSRPRALSATYDPTQFADPSVVEKVTKSMVIEVEKEIKSFATKVARKKRVLEISLSKNLITQTRVSKEHRKDYSPDQLVYIVKSRSQNHKLKISWKDMPQRDQFLFPTLESRERFYLMAALMARGGINKPIRMKHPIEIFVGSWNMGEATPPDNLESWIPRERYDVYVINTQESQYIPKSLQATPNNNSCQSDWFDSVMSHLGKNYIKIAGLSLLSIFMIVLVKREHFYRITQVETGSFATGIGGVIGNKGGVGVSFKFNETTLCFVGSHLAARQHEWDNRNANYRDIVRNLQLGPQKKTGGFDLLNQFHYLFWSGDLNYRIDINRQRTLDYIAKGDLKTLLDQDQLLNQQKLGNCFVGFTEAEIKFAPTYRYNRGNRTYSDEKERIPAWCDRILYRTLPGLSLTPLDYNCCNEITTSDHSPVYATFRVDTKMAPLPLPSVPCKIILTQLRLLNLKYEADNNNNKKSVDPNPYLVFSGSFLESKVISDVASKGSPPSWNGTLILHPCLGFKEYLMDQHLFFMIKHKGGVKDDEELGQGAIALSVGFGEAAEFHV